MLQKWLNQRSLIIYCLISALYPNWNNNTLFAQTNENKAYSTDTYDTFKYKGVYYRPISQTEVEVIMPYNNKYSGVVHLPSTVKYNGYNYTVSKISDYAFAGCVALKELTLPHTINSFGEGVFWNTKALKAINIEKGTTNVYTEDGLLYLGNTLITSISPNLNCKVKDGTNKICSYALCGENVELLTLELPESIDTIEMAAFQNQTSLDTITLPSQLQYIGNRAFEGCKLLRNIVIPDQVEHVGFFCFYDCSSLKTLHLGKRLKEVGEGIVYDCISLRAIYCYAKLPPSMLHIENGVFYFSNMSETISMFIPKQSEVEYRNSCDWKEFHLTFSPKL